MEQTMEKQIDMSNDRPYSIYLELNPKLLTILYMCYTFELPLSLMISLYSSYGEMALFVFKILAHMKVIKLTDNDFTRVLTCSRSLYKHILNMNRVKIDRERIIQDNKTRTNKKEVPSLPTMNLDEYTESYRNFITNYLLENIVDIYAPEVELKLNTVELHQGIINGN